MKQLRLKNYLLMNNPMNGIASIQDWLHGLLLHGLISRMRTRFIKLLTDRITEIDKERIEMLKRLADKKEVVTKDKDGKETKELKPLFLVYEIGKDGQVVRDPKTGKPVIKEETTNEPVGGSYKITDENLIKFESEWKEYLNEDLIIDVSPANQDVIYGVRDLILKTTEQFDGRMGNLYDEWCLSFEDIKDEGKIAKNKVEEPK